HFLQKYRFPAEVESRPNLEVGRSVVVADKSTFSKIKCTMESSCTSNHSPSVQSQTDTKCIQCQSIFEKAKRGYKRYSLKYLSEGSKFKDIPGLTEYLLQRCDNPESSFVCEKCVKKYRESRHHPSTMESSCTSNHSPSVQSQTDTKCIQCQ
ncbi:unnamed protein product, partial [Owenia fusiformis]